MIPLREQLKEEEVKVSFFDHFVSFIIEIQYSVLWPFVPVVSATVQCYTSHCRGNKYKTILFLCVLDVCFLLWRPHMVKTMNTPLVTEAQVLRHCLDS